MNLTLTRDVFDPEFTLGVLTVDGKDFGYTVEDTIREVKVHGKTAIPEGRYRVDWTLSQRFGRYMPLLLNVPGFRGIRIHPGNSAADTEGCILPGLRRTSL